MSGMQEQDGQDDVMAGNKGLKRSKYNLGSIQVSWVLHCARVIAIVSVLDNRVKKLSKHLIKKESNV